jgi:hypothetical protein
MQCFITVIRFRLSGHKRAMLNLLFKKTLPSSDFVQCRKEILNLYITLKLLQKKKYSVNSRKYCSLQLPVVLLMFRIMM